MAQQQPLRVVVEHRKSRSGCGAVLLTMVLIGLAIKYWYVSIGILVLVVALAAIASQQQKEKAREQARLRPGPRDPWLNEVAVALAELGFHETARNTGSKLGGVPLEGDINLRAEHLAVYVNLFSDIEQVRHAELGLRANPTTRAAIAAGRSVIKPDGRVLYVANADGTAVDDFRLDEVMRTVGKIALPPPLPLPAGAKPSGDALEQLGRLGHLRDTGVLTPAEFEAKKAELLRRV